MKNIKKYLVAAASVLAFSLVVNTAEAKISGCVNDKKTGLTKCYDEKGNLVRNNQSTRIIRENKSAHKDNTALQLKKAQNQTNSQKSSVSLKTKNGVLYRCTTDERNIEHCVKEHSDRK